MSNNAIKILRICNSKDCIILERINKFTVKILLGYIVQKAYINNTGRLLDYVAKGRTGFCFEHRGKLKTDYRLFAVRENDLAVIIDTQLQMRALEKIVALNLIPWVTGCRILKRNARLGISRIDYLLECDGRKVYLEVKSAVLKSGKYAMYPDCPSVRGRRHIAELTNHVKKGGRGIILFVAAMPDVKVFKPNRSADPEISRLLLEAKEARVDIRALEMYYNPEDFYVYLSNPNLPIEL